MVSSSVIGLYFHFLCFSVHADSIANHRIRGGGIYTLSEKASDKESAALAAHENRADLISGLNLNVHDDEVASILIELTQRETMNFSAQFTTFLISELRQLISMRRKPHRFAGFVVFCNKNKLVTQNILNNSSKNFKL